MTAKTTSKLDPELIKEICLYYEKHGRNKTKDAFPNVNVLHVIYKHKQFKPRQLKWTDENIIRAAQMGGLVSNDKQAKMFNRPNAAADSLDYLWKKKLKVAPGTIHGLVYEHGQYLAKESCPTIKLKMFRLYLWVDLENNLRPGLPREIIGAIRTLADFQRWLFKPKDPKTEILNLLKG